MKTIQQLLKLSENPFYKLTANEQAVLDDFLSEKSGSVSKKSQKKSSSESSKKTRVIVRNVVKKSDTYPPEDAESPQETS